MRTQAIRDRILTNGCLPPVTIAQSFGLQHNSRERSRTTAISTRIVAHIFGGLFLYGRAFNSLTIIHTRLCHRFGTHT